MDFASAFYGAVYLICLVLNLSYVHSPEETSDRSHYKPVHIYATHSTFNTLQCIV